MSRTSVLALACAALTMVVLTTGAQISRTMAKEKAVGPKLVHNVFFTLKDGSPESIQKLVDACDKYLTDHPGTVFYAAGPLVAELDRAVNVRDFHVGLHVIFADKAAHDLYQEAPRHLQFIAENKETWAEVRVFDTYSK